MAASTLVLVTTTSEIWFCERKAGAFTVSGITRFLQTAPAYYRSLPKRLGLGRRYTPTPTLPRKRGREFPLTGTACPLQQFRGGPGEDDLPYRNRCRGH